MDCACIHSATFEFYPVLDIAVCFRLSLAWRYGGNDWCHPAADCRLYRRSTFRTEEKSSLRHQGTYVNGRCVLLGLTPQAKLDLIDIAAGPLGAWFMAFSTILSRKWKPPVSNLTFTVWQLSTGGVMLVTIAFIFEPLLLALNSANLAGFAYLCLIGIATTYILWFRGYCTAGIFCHCFLGPLSPVAAVRLGWLFLKQNLSLTRWSAFALILVAVWQETRLATKKHTLKFQHSE